VKPVIAVPYHPGSNGDYDVIERIREFGMKPLPLYFHIGQPDLEKNAEILAKGVDGAVLPGGFPYEDRLGFGKVPAKLKPFAQALRKIVDKGKPVLAFCAGDQISQAMRLAFPEDHPYRVSILENVCNAEGEVRYHGFRNDLVYTRLQCLPERTAFTRHLKEGEVVREIIAHGGGRFWADSHTLRYIVEEGLVVTQYCDETGEVKADFPINPNGSMLNIESITNRRGNLKIGMAHNERKINALRKSRANEVFASMREFIEEGCPDLLGYAQKRELAGKVNDFLYLSQPLNPARTLEIYVKMLTDDNERTTAQLFLGEGLPLERRRLLCLELAEGYDDIQKVLVEIAKMDFFDGIMLKKDLPLVSFPGEQPLLYTVKERREGKIVREFVPQKEIVPGFPVRDMQVSLPNPGGYKVLQMLRRNSYLREAVRQVHTGKVWFFRNEEDKKKALEELLE